MIAFLSEYFQNIAIFMVFMALMMFILPSGKYKNYIQIVLGFVLIYIVLTPVTALFHRGDAQLSWQVEWQARHDSQLEIVQNLHDEMVTARFHTMLRNQIQGLGPGTPFRLVHVETSQTDNEELLLYITVERREPTPTTRPFIRIEPVEFTNRSTAVTDTAEESAEIKKLKLAISDFYNLPVDNIHITEQKTNEGDGRNG